MLPGDSGQDLCLSVKVSDGDCSFTSVLSTVDIWRVIDPLQYRAPLGANSVISELSLILSSDLNDVRLRAESFFPSFSPLSPRPFSSSYPHTQW